MRTSGACAPDGGDRKCRGHRAPAIAARPRKLWNLATDKLCDQTLSVSQPTPSFPFPCLSPTLLETSQSAARLRFTLVTVSPVRGLIRQLERASLDAAVRGLLISRRRAELKDLSCWRNGRPPSYDRRICIRQWSLQCLAAPYGPRIQTSCSFVGYEKRRHSSGMDRCRNSVWFNR